MFLLFCFQFFFLGVDGGPSYLDEPRENKFFEIHQEEQGFIPSCSCLEQRSTAFFFYSGRVARKVVAEHSELHQGLLQEEGRIGLG